MATRQGIGPNLLLGVPMPVAFPDRLSPGFIAMHIVVAAAVAALLLAGSSRAAAQADTMTGTGQLMKLCMDEMGLKAPLDSAQAKEMWACVRRKQDEARPKTPEERQQRAQELRERMLKDAEDSRARQRQAAEAESARLAEVRAGAFGPQMQVAVTCRESLLQRGLKPEAPQWVAAITACVQQTLPPATTHALPAPGTDAWCALETRRRNIRDGIPDGAVYSKDPNAKAVTRDAALCATLGGQNGIDLQATYLCSGELHDLYITSGTVRLGGFNELLERCEQRRLRELKAQAARPAGEQPFGDATRVHDYLNALYTDDMATLLGVDRALTFRTGVGINVTLLTLILQNYFSLYPTVYVACLEPNAPTIVIGEVYDDVTRDGTGMEIRRNRVDTRRAVPVNRRFYEMARSAGIGEGSRLEDGVISAFGGVYLRGLSSARVNEAVQQLMRAHRCDSAVTRRLEEKFIQYYPQLRRS
jgi:hypothetical protein